MKNNATRPLFYQLEAGVKPPAVRQDGVPKWNMKRMIVFLSREDKCYITKKFFFDTVKMPNSGGPGSMCHMCLCGNVRVCGHGHIPIICCLDCYHFQ